MAAGSGAGADKISPYSNKSTIENSQINEMIIPLMSLGGIRVISALASVPPQQIQDICQLYLGARSSEVQRYLAQHI